jgi:hypothetical protein
MHGQGFARGSAVSGAMGGENSAALATRCNPAVFLAYHNSGQHHPDSIRRLLPAADALGGAKLHCLLNFFEAVTSQANAVTFTKSDGLVVTLCDVGLDGLMLGAGTMVDEHDLSIVGLTRRVGVEEATKVLSMDDVQRTAYYQSNPAIQSAVRPSD